MRAILIKDHSQQAASSGTALVKYVNSDCHTPFGGSPTWPPQADRMLRGNGASTVLPDRQVCDARRTLGAAQGVPFERCLSYISQATSYFGRQDRVELGSRRGAPPLSNGETSGISVGSPIVDCQSLPPISPLSAPAALWEWLIGPSQPVCLFLSWLK